MHATTRTPDSSGEVTQAIKPRTQSPDPTALTPAREAGTGTLGQCSRPLATSPNLRTDYARKAVGQARLERKWRFHT